MSTGPEMAAPALRATDISKRFGGVVALDNVSIDLAAGQITGLVGDNGAGKSTLIRILSAVLTPDSGTIELQGQPVHFTSPADAREAGPHGSPASNCAPARGATGSSAPPGSS